MSSDTRQLLRFISASLPGARGIASLWLAIGLFVLTCALAMGSAGSGMLYWLVLAPLAVLAVLGPAPSRARSSQV